MRSPLQRGEQTFSPEYVRSRTPSLVSVPYGEAASSSPSCRYRGQQVPTRRTRSACNLPPSAAERPVRRTHPQGKPGRLRRIKAPADVDADARPEARNSCQRPDATGTPVDTGARPRLPQNCRRLVAANSCRDGERGGRRGGEVRMGETGVRAASFVREIKSPTHPLGRS